MKKGVVVAGVSARDGTSVRRDEQRPTRANPSEGTRQPAAGKPTVSLERAGLRTVDVGFQQVPELTGV